MFGIKEKSLERALNSVGCHELPKAFNEDGITFWIEALALVRKRNGSQSYCYVTHAPDGKVEYKEDFGELSPIHALLSVHPFIFLDKNKFGFFCTESELKATAQRLGYTHEDVDAMDDERKKILRIECAIHRQKSADEEAIAEARIEEDFYGEDGITDIFSDYKSSDTNGFVQKRDDEKNVITAEDGSKETFVDLAPTRSKRGRKKNS